MNDQRGFTLIELLVVLLVIGITAGVAVVTLTTNDRRLPQTIAKELARELRLASVESLLRPATLGFVLTRCGWQFQIFTETPGQKPAWQPFLNRALPQKCLPPKLGMRLTVQGHRIVISEGGEFSPFVILVYQQKSNVVAKITGFANGTIEVSADHAP